MGNNFYENNNQRNYNNEPPHDDRGNDKKNQNNNNSSRPQGFFTLFLFLILIGFLGIWVTRSFMGCGENEIKYSDFMAMIWEHSVDKVVIGTDRIYVYPKTNKEDPKNYLAVLTKTEKYYYTAKIEDDDTLTARLLGNGIPVSGEIPSNSGEIIYFILFNVLPIVLMVAFTVFIFRKISKGGGMGGMMNVGKSNAKVYVQKETGITFADVAGEDEAIESLQEVAKTTDKGQNHFF